MAHRAYSGCGLAQRRRGHLPGSGSRDGNDRQNTSEGKARGPAGAPTLTAVLVILTGIAGAVVATPLLNALRIRDWRARGLAVGVASHGIGTARAFQVNPTAGAFAGLGMALNAVATAFIAPLVLALFL